MSLSRLYWFARQLLRGAAAVEYAFLHVEGEHGMAHVSMAATSSH